MNESKSEALPWLLRQQYREIHAYTNAPPGGWAWTDLPGGVPDADDTAGALLALHRIGEFSEEVCDSAAAAVRWLCRLQNRDGGIPTFCKGWGALPFDRSSPDLTAHALRAWQAWEPHLGQEIKPMISRAGANALKYLAGSQKEDGTWIPLWFGNQQHPHDENPVYGTSRVLRALNPLREKSGIQHMIDQAVGALVRLQNADGSWSGSGTGPGSVEETALAIESLADSLLVREEPALGAFRKGCEWLLERVEDGSFAKPAPIGFYFAKLWYYEELYPLIFTVAALRESQALQRHSALIGRSAAFPPLQLP